MPRHYKAVIDHSPIDYHKDLRAIARYFRGKGAQFLAIYDRWKLPAPAHDDLRALLEQVTRRLIDFALACDAIPMRTPLKLMPTVRRIARRPAEFLAKVHKYDPQAVALVYDSFTRGCRENRLVLSQFEAGEDTRPPDEEIARAASVVLADLQRKNEDDSHKGGQTLVLQRELIQDLAVMFVRSGGSGKRTTQFNMDLPALYIYHGPFHAFLALVLIPVRPFARKSGFKMESIRSLATIPDWENLDMSETDPWLFGKHEDRGLERGPARVGNFFKLHAHRLKNGSKVVER
ncbi:hypothetical protein DK847_00100 [Aestuariivirga litoralis]|uniref:Uncharacterized protein n=1 Tax=Aestuariivirga litoralis TaxID=2650924 RepID=A0A2W2BXT6_9HYPH|nr:hypothetical protein [Aestuariivirga litoralis]PZF78266.1 hypothetical protein DK847_00100 [Aestuariivirga litoralis]